MSEFVRELERVYPTTLRSLRRADQEDLIHQFENFLVEDLSGVNEPARWLPLFLKTREVPSKILQASEWEWAHLVCQIVDFGRRPLQTRQIHYNPSMQFIELHEEMPELNRQPGLYGIYRLQSRVLVRQFCLAQALILESLHEERTFTRAQLIEFVEEEARAWPRLQESRWPEVIEEMLDSGALVENDEVGQRGQL